MKVSFLFTILVILNTHVAFTQDDNSFYLWNTTSLNVELNDKNILKLSTKSHFQTDAGVRDMTFVDLGLSREINHWLRLGLAFRGVQYNTPGNDTEEYRPQLFSSVTLLNSEFEILSTNRYEYRFFDQLDEHSRYAHNIFFHFPPILGGFPNLYVGEELFVKLNSEGLHIGRLYGGLNVWESDWFEMDLFYVWQQMKYDEAWSRSDVIGLNLIFSI